MLFYVTPTKWILDSNVLWYGADAVVTNIQSILFADFSMRIFAAKNPVWLNVCIPINCGVLFRFFSSLFCAVGVILSLYFEKNHHTVFSLSFFLSLFALCSMAIKCKLSRLKLRTRNKRQGTWDTQSRTFHFLIYFRRINCFKL